MTALSSTTLSGYVDTSGIWPPNTFRIDGPPVQLQGDKLKVELFVTGLRPKALGIHGPDRFDFQAPLLFDLGEPEVRLGNESSEFHYFGEFTISETQMSDLMESRFYLSVDFGRPVISNADLSAHDVLHFRLQPIPEPGTAVIAGIGIVALWGRRKLISRF